MKKIAIILNEMSIGGIPKASITFMQELTKYADVTLLLANDKGELTNQIPMSVNVKTVPYKRAGAVFSKLFQEKKFIQACWFWMKTFYYGHITKRWVKNHCYIASKVGYLWDEEYDCAMAFHGMNIDHLTRTMYQVKAKKKTAWIHGDHPFEGKHKEDVTSLYEKFDRIYCGSGICKHNFLSDFPSVANKTKIFYQPLDVDRIKEMSMMDMDFSYPEDSFNILTVGRISPEKGQDMIPTILQKIEANGQKVKWFLVGDGSDRSRIEELAKVNECVDLVFLGAKTNPYPYMRGCDLYVQPSYSEAYSLTAFEAATLGKAIILTDVAGATEILTDGKNVIVVQPNPDSVANGIQKVLDDENLKKILEKNVAAGDFSNKQMIKPLVDWI